MNDEMARNKPDYKEKVLYIKSGKKDIEEMIISAETEVPIRQGK